jgi:hypothetical protein
MNEIRKSVVSTKPEGLIWTNCEQLLGEDEHDLVEKIGNLRRALTATFCYTAAFRLLRRSSNTGWSTNTASTSVLSRSARGSPSSPAGQISSL